MTYHKVKKEYDNMRIHDKNTGKYLGIIIGDELLTAAEIKRVFKNKIPEKALEEVQINKNHTHILFGTRFKKDTGVA